MKTVKEVAAILGVNPKTVYLVIRSGRLRCHRIGNGRGTIRISDAQLAEYMGNCEQTEPTTRTPAKLQLRHLCV